MMRSAILGLLVSCLIVGLGEIFFHRYAGTQETPRARAWNAWYLQRDPRNDKNSHAGLVDLVLPSVFLGLAVGIVTVRRSQRCFIICILLLPLCAAALFPYYAAALPSRESDEWWRFAGNGTRVGYLLLIYIKSILLCLVSGIFARPFAGHFRGLPQEDHYGRL